MMRTCPLSGSSLVQTRCSAGALATVRSPSRRIMWCMGVEVRTEPYAASRVPDRFGGESSDFRSNGQPGRAGAQDGAHACAGGGVETLDQCRERGARLAGHGARRPVEVDPEAVRERVFGAGCWGSTVRPGAVSLAAVTMRTAWSRT